MTTHLSLVVNDTESRSPQFTVFLETAAKIVETVAFEIAERRDAREVEQLLALACAIETAAADILTGD